MAKKITVTPETRATLMDEFELKSEQTLYNALNFSTNSPTSRLIRRRAIELGGQEWVTTNEPPQPQQTINGTIPERAAQ